MDRQEIFRFLDAERLIFKAKERIKVSDYAEKYRFVVMGTTPGKWRNDLAPYAVEPMNTFGLPWVRKVFLEWAPQTAKTSTAINCLNYCVDIAPGPAFYIMPDEKVAKRMSRRQLIPTFKKTPKIAELLSDRADDVSTLYVKFKNGMDLMMAWASSAASIASESARYIFYDEVAKYPEFSGKEADPLSLGSQRQNRYESISKQLYFSTPNMQGDIFDKVIADEADEVRRYHAVCPYCEFAQIMKFKQIHWQGSKDHLQVKRKFMARYTCINCGMDWDDYTRNQAVKKGFWKAEKPIERPMAVAFRELASWYSTVSMSTAAAEFMIAQKDLNKMQGWITQHACRAWVERVTSQNEDKLLAHRNTIPEGIVPDWALALTAGIDVQKHGFWFVVRAWGVDLTSHLVQYGYLSTFEDVKTLVFGTSFQMENAEKYMKIMRAAMDTGGGQVEGGISRTEEIYDFIATWGQGVIHAVKGASNRQFSIVGPEREVESRDKHTKRRRFPGRLYLRLIDTHSIKVMIYDRLEHREAYTAKDGTEVADDPQRFYLHAGTGMDYAKQFLAEELRKTRGGKQMWIKLRNDNHLLDCEVYAAACAHSTWYPSLKEWMRYNEQKALIKSRTPDKAKSVEKVTRW